MTFSIKLTLFAALLAPLAACGGDSTGPDSVSFPTISQSTLDANCIRGTAAPPASVSGSISNADCPVSGTLVGAVDGFWEGWRVRVNSATTVTFAVTSSFDSFLDLFVINVSSPALNNLRIFDDDSGAGLDALFTFTLQPDTEYWIMVSGFDATDTGSFTLAMD